MSDIDSAAWCLRLLRRFREATLAFGDRTDDIRFVIDRTDGRLVMPIESAAAKHTEFTLHLPSQSDCEASAIIDSARIERPEGSEAVDRWSVYHGTPPTSATWTTSRILGLKSMDDAANSVMDESILTVPNLLGTAEFRLIRLANADRPLLTRAARAIAGIDLDDASCIGVDPDGIDVRAPFGIVRLEFPYAAADIPTAELMLTALLASGGQGA
jgi:hypothetical protein